MKILQLISSYGFFGAENVVLELSKELNSQNIENVIGVFKNLQNPHTEIVQHAKESNLKATVFKCNGKVDLKTLYNITQFVKKMILISSIPMDINPIPMDLLLLNY